MSCEHCNLTHQSYTDKGVTEKRVFIEGPQGCGKSILVSLLGESLSMQVRRGFPSGEFLKRSRSRLEVCQEADLLVLASSRHTVFDRSPISQHVWLARNGNDFEKQVVCAKNSIKRLGLENTAYLFIDSDLSSCQLRQDPKGLCAVDPSEVGDEIEMYRRFAYELKQVLGERLIIIQNTLFIKREEFFHMAIEELRKTWL